jgi:hypothetical protein
MERLRAQERRGGSAGAMEAFSERRRELQERIRQGGC